MDTYNQSNSDSPQPDATTVSAQEAKTPEPGDNPEPASRVRRKRAQEQNPQRRTKPVSRARKRRLTARYIKAQIQAKLGCLANAQLKRVLIACGIAASIAIAIVAFTKLVPVGVAILAILGLGVVVRFMQELRRLPFYPSL